MPLIYLIPISGRPNAGKTSLVNYLSHSKRPVGKQAGTTITITSIPLIKNLHLVDLPGFGRITKRSKKCESQIKDDIVHFLEDPSNQLLFAIHIIDVSTFHLVVASLEKKQIVPLDIEMIQFISDRTNLPPIVVLNKIDKVKREIVEQNIALLKSYNLPEFELFLLSLKTKNGCRPFRNRVKELSVQKLGTSYQNW
ncbi:MAG: GTPase [Promethearchaeota archaeon]